MSELVTLELPSELVRRARAAAAAPNRELEEAIAGWIERAVAESCAASLSDAELLAACDRQLPDAIQNELSDLLADNRDGPLAAPARRRLDELLTAYRNGLTIKARALNEAVARGLRPRLGDHAA